jgi:hypothetical protein
MNKKSILLILLSTLALGANAQGKYTIKGNLQNAEGQKIYLYSGDKRVNSNKECSQIKTKKIQIKPKS